MSLLQDQGTPPVNENLRVIPHPAPRQGSDPASERSNTSSTDVPKTRSVVEGTTKGKLLTYQIAAVVSAVLAGTESQLLLFFKSSSSYSHPLAPSTLRWLLILTYTALIFSISSTVSSLVLTENFGDSLRLAKRLRKVKRRLRVGKLMHRRTGFGSSVKMATPRRWKWMEYHWLFTLVVSVLCLLVQILVYIWTQELVLVRAVIAGVGIFGMFPLLHFLPIRWGSNGNDCHKNIEPGPLEAGTAMREPSLTGSPQTLLTILHSPPSDTICSHSLEPTNAV